MRYYAFIILVLINGVILGQEWIDGISSVNEKDSVVIYDVIYDYELFYDDSGITDTEGNVSFRITVPDNTYRIIIRSSLPQYDYLEFTRYPIFYGIVDKEIYIEEESDIAITVERKRWGAYIKAMAYIENDSTIIQSEPINTLDYLSDEDRTAVLDYTGIEDVNMEKDFQLFYDRIELKSASTGVVYLYGLNGEDLFYMEFSGTHTIPFSDNLPRCFILHVVFSDGGTITKKINR